MSSPMSPLAPSLANPPKPPQGEQPHSPEGQNAKPPGNDLPMARFKFTSFVEVKAIKFPRGMSSSEDETGEKKRKPAGWYPQMTTDEERRPRKNKKRKHTNKNDRTDTTPRNGGHGMSTTSRTDGDHVLASRGGKWTEEEDIFAMETWAEWPECTYADLTDLINEKFLTGRTDYGVRQHFVGWKGWMRESLNATSEQHAPSDGGEGGEYLEDEESNKVKD